MTAIPPTFRRQDLREAPGSRTPQAAPASADVAVTSKSDHSSQKHLLKSLSSSWIAHGVQIVSGFILPRLISDELGQGVLGVWDFGWAIVSYFALLQVGIVSSVNRYVARHRAAGETHHLNVAVNSVDGVLKAIATLIAVLSVIAAWLVPALMADRLAGQAEAAQWVILCLGLTAAVETQGALYGGVITGCHRWTVQNALKTMAAILSVGGAVAVILCGGTIGWVAAVMLGAEVALRVVQRITARRICPELHFSLRYFSRRTAAEMFQFGGKTCANVISQMLVTQTTSVIVASSFGVAALALFSRPRSLVRTVRAVVDNSASILVPTVSALDAEGRLSEIRQLAIAATRYAVFGCLPAIVGLVILGGDLMHVWMGASYVDPSLLAIFAIGGFSEACCFPLHRVLMGLNRHGWVGLLNLGSAIVSAVFASVVALVLKLDLIWIAVAIVVPSFVANAVLLPIAAAKTVKIGLWELLAQTCTQPVLCMLPAAACLLATSTWFQGTPVERLLLGAASAVAASGWLYWRHALPERVRNAILNRMRSKSPAQKKTATAEFAPASETVS